MTDKIEKVVILRKREELPFRECRGQDSGLKDQVTELDPVSNTLTSYVTLGKFLNLVYLSFIICEIERMPVTLL